MRFTHRAPQLAALVAVAAFAWALPTFAQDRTTITKVSGTVGGTGSWGRTIIDAEPGKTTSIYKVIVPYTPGLSADSVAARFRTAARVTLPPAPNSSTGFGVLSENSVLPSVRVGRQTGTYTYSDSAAPPGITLTTFPPSNSEHAPVVSPAGLAMLMTSLTGLAWWMRRRRRIA